MTNCYQKRFESEKGFFRVAGKIAHVRGVEWPILFLWAKREPGDGVIN
jgi:hypothetical protein